MAYQKDKVDFKIYDVTTWLAYNHTVPIHILSNISRNKGNQTMKCGLLLFVLRVFSKKSKLS